MRYLDRDGRLLELAKGKSVLHLGCVGFADQSNNDRIALAKNSLHYLLSNESDVIGVDYCEEAIRYFRDHSIFDNVLFGNVERLEDLPIQRTFDFIVVGDIIEHLSNPGLMLDGIKRFCGPNTVIVITTPHAFGLLNYIRWSLSTFKDGKEHVMTFNSQNIQHLLERHNYDLISIDTCHQRHATSRAMFAVGKRFFHMFPRFGGTLFVTARRAST